MLRMLQRYAAGFQSHGVKPGDKVLVHVEDSVESLVAMYGIVCAGGVVIPSEPGSEQVGSLGAEKENTDPEEGTSSSDLGPLSSMGSSCVADGRPWGVDCRDGSPGLFGPEVGGGRPRPGGAFPCSEVDASEPASTMGLGPGATGTAPVGLGGDFNESRRSSGDVWVPVDAVTGRAGPLRTTSAYPPFDEKENRFFASTYVVGPGEIGELWAKSPTSMRAYHNNPEATRAVVTPDGWLKSGDIAYYDETGRFYLVERLKQFFLCMGRQVAQSDIETVLLTHEGIEEAAVVDVPHPEYNDVGKAFVVLKPSHRRETTAQELKEFVSERLAVYKHLYGGVVFVDSIPKNALGKTDKRSLKRSA
ncbi:4-coumarate--CoA ligase-like 6 [Ixodes scapularis]